MSNTVIQLLTAVALLSYAATCAQLLCYRRGIANYRLQVSLVAWLLIVFTGTRTPLSPNANKPSNDSTMKTSLSALGPSLLCLTLLPGCANVPPRPAQTLIVNACPPVTRCTLPAGAPTTNGALNLTLERAEAAWADCAAQIDMIHSCQSEIDDVQTP